MGNFPCWASAHDIFSWMAVIPLSLQPPNTHIKHTCVCVHTNTLPFCLYLCRTNLFLFRAIRSIRFTFRNANDYQAYALPLPFPSKSYSSSLLLIGLTHICWKVYSEIAIFYSLAPMNLIPSTVPEWTLLSYPAGILYQKCCGPSSLQTFIHVCSPCNTPFLSCINLSIHFFTHWSLTICQALLCWSKYKEKCSSLSKKHKFFHRNLKYRARTYIAVCWMLQ